MSMTRLLIASDLHGNADSLKTLYDVAVRTGCAAILMAGDQCPGASATFATALASPPIPLVMVRGNCDGSWEYDGYLLRYPPRFRIYDWDGRTILLTHGDAFTSPEMTGTTLKPGDLFVTGHTHVPLLVKEPQGWLHLNPGSASRGRGKSDPSYALADGDGITIYVLETGKPIASIPWP
ncbi:metallophosphoesterase family protein [Parasphaerochaeta coccoides]|uniref:Metallophosphoesterase n=1 Tax=Parasphaerochaeta coccoides (strain ATCC BAA-1237 / DSM 17374 / SPN1) TaxID=760011 RepID=F4GLP2_PARC1|nr:metallophosphoesterase family protein [Parasphaerochaeta coccoides]AEC02436.1 metallophosphoesterase [Parasphaerochaeta coccoides DSM 17374]